MPAVSVRVQKYRESLRRAGLRPMQIWVPDTRRAGFAEECRLQSRIASEADRADNELAAFLSESADSVNGWTA